MSARARIAAAMLMSATGLIAAGCGGESSAARHAPTIHVVTGLFPLAQAIEQIGQDKVTVTDVVPAGDDPTTYRLTAVQVAQVQDAPVVVDVGGGFQPSLEAAAAGRSEVAGPSGAQVDVNLQTELRVRDPYVWLDPKVMGQAVNLIAAALERANPAAAPVYRDGARAFGEEVLSTGIDYSDTLLTCTRRMIVTPDGAFAAVASEYGLTDEIVGTASNPSAVALTAAANRLEPDLTTLFAEPFADDGTITALAGARGLKDRVLDPLTGPPPGGWVGRTDYLSLMEKNLATLYNALGCPNADTGQ